MLTVKTPEQRQYSLALTMTTVDNIYLALPSRHLHIQSKQ